MASGTYLVAGYNGYDNGHQVNNDIASWRIGAGCTLRSLQTYEIVNPVFNMAATPNKKTLVFSYCRRQLLRGLILHLFRRSFHPTRALLCRCRPSLGLRT